MALAFWWTGPLCGELRETETAEPGPGEVRVRTLYSGISRGTERLVARGLVPASERQRMRCPFQAGEFPFPVSYGYAAVGVVEAGPEALQGRHVFALHPHQSAFVLPATAVRPLPRSLPPGRAVLAPNVETALNAVWDAEAGPGDRIVVLGAGVVGCLIAWIAAGLRGSEVTLVDVDPGRRELAEALGARFAQPGEAPGEADIVVEASGVPAALASAIDLAAFEATILVVGWYGEHQVSLPLGGPFHSRRLRLVCSQVGAVSPARRPRWDHARRLDKALDLLADPVLDRLIDGATRFADLPQAFPRILNAAGLCHRVAYDTQGD